MDHEQRLLWNLEWEVVGVRKLVIPLQSTIDHDRVGVDVLVEMTNHHDVKSLTDSLFFHLLPASSTHDWGHDSTNSITTAELVTVGEEETNSVDGEESVRTLWNIEGDLGGVSEVRNKALVDQPFVVVERAVFISRLFVNPAMVTSHTGDVDLPELVHHRLKSLNEGFLQLDHRDGYWTVIRFRQFLVNVPGDHVSAQWNHDSVVVGECEMTLQDFDCIAESVLDRVNGDDRVELIDTSNLSGVDDLSVVQVRQKKNGGASG